MNLEVKAEDAMKLHNDFLAALERLPNVVYKASSAFRELANSMDAELEQIVKDFIKDFRAMHPDEIEDLFLHGYCYWFAKILEIRFEGEIYYMPIDNHFITKIGKNYYDIRGKLTEDEINPSMPWEEYQYVDSLEVKRIYRDCINKEKF